MNQMHQRKLRRRSGAVLIPLLSLLLSADLIIHCSSTQQKLEAASFQSTELSGSISVATVDGKKVPRLTTPEGKVYTIVGKLDRMIRDFYSGQTLRLAGRIESEPDANRPGVFRVEEIILELR
jgi:hypothetical protein